MLYNEMAAVSFEIYMKRINTLQEVDFLDIWVAVHVAITGI